MPWPKGKPRQTETENVPHGTSTEEVSKPIETKKEVVKKERQFSDETDRKGPFHPLCLGCNHREDMHHTWQSEQVLEDFRDQTGRVSQRLKTIKHEVYEGVRPCQHACKCTDYK